MSITDAEIKPCLIYQAIELYRDRGHGFIDLMKDYLYCDYDSNHYMFTAPDYIMLGRKETDEIGDYWHVDYAAGDGLKVFLRLMPYRLDRIGFHRYFKYSDGNLRFLDTAKLLKHYGIKTENSATTSSPTAAAATSPTADSSGS